MTTTKRVLSILFAAVILCLCTACNNTAALYEEKIAEIEEAFASADVEYAYELCNEALSLDLNEEQIAVITECQNEISSVCYPTTWLVQPEYISDISPEQVGKNSFFTVSMLLEDKYDSVFCRYTYDKESEKDLAGQRYKDYLDAKYIYLDTKYDSEYVYYTYANDDGNGIGLQIFNNNYDSNDICIMIDCDFFDLSRIDTSNRRASLTDHSIIISN